MSMDKNEMHVDELQVLSPFKIICTIDKFNN